MKLLTPAETELVGRWVTDPSGAVMADEVAQRIEWLTENALERVAFSKSFGAWETLFRDPADGRLWERRYVEGHLHGGGPPTLRLVSENEAHEKYDYS